MCHCAMYRHTFGYRNDDNDSKDKTLEYTVKTCSNDVVPIHSYDHSDMDLLYYLTIEVRNNGFKRNINQNIRKRIKY